MFRILLICCFLLSVCSWAEWKDDLSSSLQEINYGLSLATATQDVKAMLRARGSSQSDVARVRYDSIAMALHGAYYSRDFSIGTWEQATLSLENNENEFYLEDVPVFTQIKNDGQARNLIVIATSPYNSWTGGLWVNQAVHALNQDASLDPHIIGIQGYMSKAFLDLGALAPPITGIRPAKDIYDRLRKKVTALRSSRHSPVNKVGLIGFSGGGNLVLGLLAADAAYVAAREGEAELFDLGSVVFNPILHYPSSHQNLDNSIRELIGEGCRESEALTSTTWRTGLFVGRFATQGPFFMFGSEGLLQELKSRLFNEFRVIDLNTIAESSMTPGFTFDLCERFRVTGRDGDGLISVAKGSYYSEFFAQYVFDRHRWLGKDLDTPMWPDLGEVSYEEYVDLRPMIESITARLTVVFAKDDPVASSPTYVEDQTLSEEIEAVLTTLKNKDNVLVIDPDLGSHLGYFLNQHWVSRLLTRFFMRTTE